MPARLVTGFNIQSVLVDPPSLATTVEGSNAVTVPGVLSTDILLAVSPWGVAEDRYILKRAAITADATITLEWVNESAGTLDPAALTLTFVTARKPNTEVGYPLGYPN